MDPYVYPGTSVLRNLRDLRDPKNLAEFEADATGRRLKELRSKPIGGSFDAKHLKAVHGHIFQDVYAWAGQFRTVNIARSGQFYFAFANQIDPSVNKLLEQLRHENRLKGLNAKAFTLRAGYYLGAMQSTHSATATAARSASSSASLPQRMATASDGAASLLNRCARPRA